MFVLFRENHSPRVLLMRQCAVILELAPVQENNITKTQSGGQGIKMDKLLYQ